MYKCLDSFTDLNNVNMIMLSEKLAHGAFATLCRISVEQVRDKKRITNRSPPHPSGSLSCRLNVCIAHPRMKRNRLTRSLSATSFNSKHDGHGWI